MALSPRRWRARHLLGAWILYWVALVAFTVGPGALALWRVRNAPANTGSANFDFGDEGLQGAVIAHGRTVWSGSASGWTVLLWLVVPPLLIWLLWLLLRPRADAPAASLEHPPRELAGGAPDWRAAPPGRAEAPASGGQGETGK